MAQNVSLEGLQVPERTRWTDNRLSIYGSYRWLNKTPVHYFSTVLSVLDLHDYVRLMGEIPGVEAWGFDALFQRTLSDDRVTEIARFYLKNPARFKFFPPLTIAVLPFSSNVISRTYVQPHFDLTQGNPGMRLTIPGMEITFPLHTNEDLPDAGIPAMIRWNMSQFSAVALDGQHRVAALRQCLPRSDMLAQSADVPATLIVFDPCLPEGRDLLRLTRELFVDVNRTARPVDETRLILLDDRDVARRTARSMIYQTFTEDGEIRPIAFSEMDGGSSVKVLPGVPQECVDLLADRQSADVTSLKPWQFTSAFILHRVIQHFLLMDSFGVFEDMLDAESLPDEEYRETKAALAEHRAYYENDSDVDEGPSFDPDEDVFRFAPKVAGELTERLTDKMGFVIRAVFTGFRPYRQWMEVAVDLFNSADGAALRQLVLAEAGTDDLFTSSYAKDLAKHEADRFGRLKVLVRRLHKPDGWEKELPWYSVFQRALLFDYPMTQRAIAVCTPDAGSTMIDLAEAYLSGLDAIFDMGMLAREYMCRDVPLWGGTALQIKPNGEMGINPSDAAARKLAWLLRLLVCSALAARSGTDESAFVELCEQRNRKGLSKAYKESLKAIKAYLKSVDIASRQSVAEESTYDEKARDVLGCALAKAAAAGEMLRPLTPSI